MSELWRLLWRDRNTGMEYHHPDAEHFAELILECQETHIAGECEICNDNDLRKG